MQFARQEKIHDYLDPYEDYFMMPRARVVLAEDDTEMRYLLSSALRTVGYDVIEAKDGEELLTIITRSFSKGSDRLDGIDLIISDIRMPGRNGLTVLSKLRSVDWATPVFIITAFGDSDTHEEARRLGAAAVFDKPFDLEDFQQAVRNYIEPLELP